MIEPTNDQEKAAAILQLATASAPKQVAARLAASEYSELEIACLAHAWDNERSLGFAQEVLHFSETRKVLEQIAGGRMPVDRLEPDAPPEPAPPEPVPVDLAPPEPPAEPTPAP